MWYVITVVTCNPMGVSVTTTSLESSSSAFSLSFSNERGEKKQKQKQNKTKELRIKMGHPFLGPTQQPHTPSASRRLLRQVRVPASAKARPLPALSPALPLPQARHRPAEVI